MEAYFKLGIATFLAPIATALLYILTKKTPFGKVNRNVRQVIYGIVFGGLAIIGTEFGIPLNGAQVNCRDAAVLAAGLLFGGPAGIIAGTIGALERWFAVYWGVGAFTQVACSVSTFIAGIYAALLRKYMFEDKEPGFLISFAVGIVMEVLHLTMVFITNMATPEKAMAVVKACTAPMLVSNGAAVLLAALFAAMLSGQSFRIKRSNIRISQTIQRWLLITVFLAFAATSYFVFSLQNTLATTQTDSLLDLSIKEISMDIEDASDENLLALARQIVPEVEAGGDINELIDKYNMTEISIIDENGIIVNSSDPKYVGFDMSSGEQSKEFLCLLGDTKEFVQDYGVISSDASISRKYAGIKTETGFIQVGYDAEQFHNVIAQKIPGITKNRHVGSTGYVIITDENLNVVSAPTEFSEEDFIPPTEDPGQETTFKMQVNGETCYCKYISAEGYNILSILPEAEAMQFRNIALYVNTFMEILVFALLFALVYLLIKKVVVNKIQNINESLAKITSGNLDEVVNVRSNEEFAFLSDDINSTVGTLKQYIAEASARIDKELEFAKSIQTSALPNIFPAFPKRNDFDIYASMNPAKEVGGDFYDFYLTHNNTLNFLIADVSGKGIPAAMFMMRAKTELKSLTESDFPLSEVFTHGNAALCEGNDAGMFVTAWQGSLDLTTGLVNFVNAGHNPPLIKHADGKFEYLNSKAGFVLAGMDGFPYKTQEFQLVPGDTVYLYTDGVTEATNAQNELYGEERLQTAINSKKFDSMQELCEFIKADVDAFVGDAPQFDDITMVALRYLG